MHSTKAAVRPLIIITTIIGVIASIVLFFVFGPSLARVLAPVINWLTIILSIAVVITVSIAQSKKRSAAAGLTLYVASFGFGLIAWLYGFAVTLALWGGFAVIVGLLLGGVGVIPFGLIAALFHGEGAMFLNLIAPLLLSYLARVLGALLIAKAAGERLTRRQAASGRISKADVIDLAPEDSTIKTSKDA